MTIQYLYRENSQRLVWNRKRYKELLASNACYYNVFPYYFGRFGFWVRAMVFNATSNNISVISWKSGLLVEETGVPGEHHRPVAKHWQTLSHNVVSSTPHLGGIQTHNVLVIGTDCIGSFKSNYHMIMTTMVLIISDK